MGDKTGIEWTDATWNPILGCKAVSPGCDNCYAARESSGRLKHIPIYAGLAENGVFTGIVREVPERLDQPLRWKKPRRIFVNSMSDLFHFDVSREYVTRVFDVMRQAPQHSFQVLTKRPQRMASLLNDRDATPDEVDDGCELGIVPSVWDEVSGGIPLPNIWLGTSIENDTYSFRADHLRRTPAAVRFLSCEPLLGPLPSLDLTDIDWVIVGGESGPKARPMHPDWACDIRDRCVAAGIPFLFKQWGEWVAPDQFDSVGYDDVMCNERGLTIWPSSNTSAYPPNYNDLNMGAKRLWHVGKKAAGRHLDGRTWDEYPTT